MIKEQDVIRMRVPFPNISSNLALNAHMYICGKDTAPHYGFIKCQTLKPYMLNKRIITHYVDEAANATRNPFSRTSCIDCDKLFVSYAVHYDDRLKTTTRPDICGELYHKVKTTLTSHDYKTIAMDEEKLVALNALISKIANDK